MTTTANKGPSSPPAKREPAPGELGLVQEFINEWDLLEGVDRLSQPRSLEAWLNEHGLLNSKGRVSEADLRHAVEVREALRDLLSANYGEPVRKDAVETLSRAARSAQLVVQFEGSGGANLEPAASGVDAALGKILAIAFRAMVDGTWQRLKVCRDDTCRWAFYDRSKNRSGSWCLMSVCGNRCKARKHRQHAHASDLVGRPSRRRSVEASSTAT
ncbi:MAG TPA: ABATE domain-containing protein [Candidatus Acidoferrales bacterium]|nr:ABATE domain-containing protein [Candidatus Acidoferrales bacterium]